MCGDHKGKIKWSPHKYSRVFLLLEKKDNFDKKEFRVKYQSLVTPITVFARRECRLKLEHFNFI